MPVVWHDKEVMRAARAVVRKGMRKAMAFIVGRVKVSINVGNPTGKYPSAPGEPPRKVTARLFQSITSEVAENGDVIIGRYGTNVEYARELEFGRMGTNEAGTTVHMEPRPFLRPALAANQDAITKLIADG